jgi:hypothetical protein
MEKNKITFKVTLELDEKWASNLTTEEIIDYIKTRVNSSLGFKGAVKKFRVVSDRKKQI